MSDGKIKIGIVGLGFGEEFIPIYLKHPNCGSVAICTRRQDKLDEIGGKYNIPEADRFTDYEQMLEQGDIDASRFLFETNRQYTESFNIYGEKMTFEWQQVEPGTPVLFKGETATVVDKVPDYGHRLPMEIREFTGHGVYDENNPHLSFIQGAGHGGSHPHLVHEFISSIVEGREPAINAITSAYWTAAGICAHESAMRDGEGVYLPTFELL